MKTILFLILSILSLSCSTFPEKNKTTETTQTAPPNTSPIAEVNCFNDYDSGLAYAKQVKKPILLSFSGYAAVNSRKMEDRIWVEPGINSLLNNDFVVINLMTDEITPLPKDKQYKSSSGKDIVTVGQRSADIEAKFSQEIRQPLYVILSNDEKILVGPLGYTPRAAVYAEFLKRGLDEFKKQGK